MKESAVSFASVVLLCQIGLTTPRKHGNFNVQQRLQDAFALEAGRLRMDVPAGNGAWRSRWLTELSVPAAGLMLQAGGDGLGASSRLGHAWLGTLWASLMTQILEMFYLHVSPTFLFVVGALVNPAGSLRSFHPRERHLRLDVQGTGAPSQLILRKHSHWQHSFIPSMAVLVDVWLLLQQSGLLRSWRTCKATLDCYFIRTHSHNGSRLTRRTL